ncbi:MAG: hypothetical protein HY928_17880 [Elusimicrobia bacterium]|nr:hypothetical protein [Elusimicrobiota bacterium]
MKTLLFLCLPVLFCAGAAAEGREGPPGEAHEEGPDMSPERMLQGLTEGLELDAKQKDKVRGEVEDSFKRSKSKREEMKALQEKMREAAKGMQEEMRRLEEGIRQHLTIEQKDKFDMMRMRRRERGERRMERREERRETIKERFKRGGGRGAPGEEEEGPGRFPPEMWHEGGAPGGGPPRGRGPTPGDQPPGAPPEPGGD